MAPIIKQFIVILLLYLGYLFCCFLKMSVCCQLYIYILQLLCLIYTNISMELFIYKTIAPLLNTIAYLYFRVEKVRTYEDNWFCFVKKLIGWKWNKNMSTFIHIRLGKICSDLFLLHICCILLFQCMYALIKSFV